MRRNIPDTVLVEKPFPCYVNMTKYKRDIKIKGKHILLFINLGFSIVRCDDGVALEKIFHGPV